MFPLRPKNITEEVVPSSFRLFRSFCPFGTGNYQRMRSNLIFRHLLCVPLDKGNDGYGDTTGRDCDRLR